MWTLDLTSAYVLLSQTRVGEAQGPASACWLSEGSDPGTPQLNNGDSGYHFNMVKLKKCKSSRNLVTSSLLKYRTSIEASSVARPVGSSSPPRILCSWKRNFHLRIPRSHGEVNQELRIGFNKN